MKLEFRFLLLKALNKMLKSSPKPEICAMLHTLGFQGVCWPGWGGGGGTILWEDMNVIKQKYFVHMIFF